MLQNARITTRVAFGLFEADLKTGELRKAGYRVKLQGLPFRVLTVLLENAGEVVTQEELQIRVWGPDVSVEFEHSLYTCIRKIREALGDSADNPRFIETLSRRGFRFIAPVDFADVPSEISGDSTVPAPVTVLSAENRLDSGPPIATEVVPATRLRRGNWVFALCCGLAGLLVGSMFQLWKAHPSASPLPRMAQITQDGTISFEDNLLGSLSAFVTDGVSLFAPSHENGHIVLSQISMSTGSKQTIPLLSEIGTPGIEDISPDGTKLLVRSNAGSLTQQPLWIVPINGESAFRVSNVLAQDAVWMHDAKSILYTSGNQLIVVSLDDGNSTLLATVAGRAFWPRWSLDGKVLRFTIIDALDHTSSLWEISEGQKVAHPILTKWNNSGHECCGIWTADGKFFVFEAAREGYTDLWKMPASLDSSPIRLTNGPLNYYTAPSPGREGERIFFAGQDVRSLLERYDSERGKYVPQPGFLAAADHIQFSRDDRWVMWVDPNHRLWRARADGTDKVLLTPPSMWVFMGAWSPDNTQVAFMARESKQPWQIYMVGVDGGVPERLLQEKRNIGDPSFSVDGRSLAFGMVPELMAEGNAPQSILTMDLTTRRVTELAHSEGLFSPRWSPDGRFISAITTDQEKMMLYDCQTGQWKTLAVTSAANPIWSKDSKALFIHAYRAANAPIVRVSVPDGHMEEIAGLADFRADTITRTDFSGITPDNIPLMRVEISSGNLYTLNLEQK